MRSASDLLIVSCKVKFLWYGVRIQIELLSFNSVYKLYKERSFDAELNRYTHFFCQKLNCISVDFLWELEIVSVNNVTLHRRKYHV